MNNFEKKNEKLIVFVFFAKIIFRYCLNKESDDEIKLDLHWQCEFSVLDVYQMYKQLRSTF
ncbi:hypothetical protein PMEGAPR185_51440 [Priestia megaterium]